MLVHLNTIISGVSELNLLQIKLKKKYYAVKMLNEKFEEENIE